MGTPDMAAVARMLAADNGNPFDVVTAAIQAKRQSADRAIAALLIDADYDAIADAYRERTRCDAALAVIREARKEFERVSDAT